MNESEVDSYKDLIERLYEVTLYFKIEDRIGWEWKVREDNTLKSFYIVLAKENINLAITPEERENFSHRGNGTIQLFRITFFTWRVYGGRIWTINYLIRRRMMVGNECKLCSEEGE